MEPGNDPAASPSTELVSSLVSQLGGARSLPSVVSVIFDGETDPRRLAVALEGYCREQLGSGVDRSLFAAASVGAVFGLALADGRRVAVKAHKPSVTRAYLNAMQTAQRHLAASGVPAPQPLAGPAPLGSGLGTAETLLANGHWADPHTSSIRASMAGALARFAAVGRSLVQIAELRSGPREILDGTLWPTPHDPRFDFAADIEGARWIDRIAEQALGVQHESRALDLVVGHTDWRVQNLRFDDAGRVSAVYDWDSLRVLPEPMLAGKQAANFTTDWSRQLPRQYPTIGEALAFIAEFEAARSAQFDDRQQRLARASLAYALAYIARCEHSDEATDSGRRPPQHVTSIAYPTDSARSLLAEHGHALVAS